MKLARSLARVAFVALAPLACSTPKPPPASPTPVAIAPAPAPMPPPAPTPPPSAPSAPLAADTPETTAFGNTFIAPAGWTVEHRGDATIVEAPEKGSRLALVDVHAPDADHAIAAAWLAYQGGPPPYKLLQHADGVAQNGWSQPRGYEYDVPPNAKRLVGASAMFANDAWLVVIADLDDAIAEKRGGQLGVVFGKLLPKGGAEESFAGKQPHELDADRLAAIAKFVTDAESGLRVPGVAYGILQNGKVVFAGGIGVRDFHEPAKVDANTEFMIASNTKQLTTLMLAKLVDSGKLAWDTPVTSLLPSFKLGDDATTKQVLVKHLICACTGMPRQDLEMLLDYKQLTPEKVMTLLGTMQPTSKFGELFQYSNLMAAAAGFVGGHVAYPKLELGAAYDKVMQSLVFGPLGMTATTFDYARAERGNHASAHGIDLDGNIAYAPMGMNDAVKPVRPAGAAWSTVNDLLRYVAMELANGKLATGKAYIDAAPLLDRAAPQVAIGDKETYGMGLMVDKSYGVTVVHHGGDVFGYHSDIMWLPDYGIGAVVLTNGDGGSELRDQFRRKLLEVLFDGKPEADAKVAAHVKATLDGLAIERKQLVIPANPAAAGKLAARYTNPALGELVVEHRGGKTIFRLNALTSEVASKVNPDGTTSFITVVPGFLGLELVQNGDDLVLRDAQHEYVYTPVKSPAKPVKSPAAPAK